MVAERRGRTMTAELAILRELAFRRKDFLLQSQHNADHEKEEKQLVPLQLLPSSPSLSPKSGNSSPTPQPSPSPRLSGMKRPAPTSSAECHSLQLPQSLDNHPMQANQTYNIFCSICHVPCSSDFNYKQHLKGRKHMAKLQEMKVPNKGRWCQVCKVWCMDENSFNMHLAQNHMKEQNGMEVAAKCLVKVKEKQTWCDLCNTGCSSEELFGLHLNGKRHKAELQRSECGRKGGGVNAKQQKWCELCDVRCPNENAFQMHLHGKNHIFRLQDIEEKRKAGNLGNCSGKA